MKIYIVTTFEPLDLDSNDELFCDEGYKEKYFGIATSKEAAEEIALKKFPNLKPDAAQPTSDTFSIDNPMGDMFFNYHDKTNVRFINQIIKSPKRSTPYRGNFYYLRLKSFFSVTLRAL